MAALSEASSSGWPRRSADQQRGGLSPRGCGRSPGRSPVGTIGRLEAGRPGTVRAGSYRRLNASRRKRHDIEDVQASAVAEVDLPAWLASSLPTRNRTFKSGGPGQASLTAVV